MMQFDETTLQGEVYTEIEDKNGNPIYYVKLRLADIWVSGITVRKSTKYPGTWWAQMPHVARPGGRRTYYVETVDGGKLRRLMEDRAIELVHAYEGEDY